PVANGYGSLLWKNFTVQPGEFFPAGMVSPTNVAVGASSASICAGTLFDLTSAYLTGGSSNGAQIRVQGLIGTNLTYDNIYTISNSPALINFNFLTIDNAKFLFSSGTFSMDDLTINIQCPAPVCENFVVGWGYI